MDPAHLDVPAAAAARSTFHDGKSRNPKFRVVAPYQSVRLPGRRLPLIVDLQGELLRPRLLDQVLLGGGSGLAFLPDRESSARGRAS